MFSQIVMIRDMLEVGENFWLARVHVLLTISVNSNGPDNDLPSTDKFEVIPHRNQIDRDTRGLSDIGPGILAVSSGVKSIVLAWKTDLNRQVPTLMREIDCICKNTPPTPS